MVLMQYLSTTVYRYYTKLLVVGRSVFVKRAAIQLKLNFLNPRAGISNQFKNPRAGITVSFRNPRAGIKNMFKNPRAGIKNMFKNPRAGIKVAFSPRSKVAP